MTNETPETPEIDRQHLADEADRATEIEMAATESSIRDAQAKTKQTQSPLPDGSYEVTDCEDCGGSIDPRRLQVAANNTLCIHCATARERIRKVYL